MTNAICHLNIGCAANLPSWSSYTGTSDEDLVHAMQQQHYAGAQSASTEPFHSHGLSVSTYGAVHQVGDLDQAIAKWQAAGFICATVHVGTGFESDAEALTLLRYVCDVVQTHGFPIYVETHRATVTQDIVRTLGFIDTLPDLRFNTDFSHYYTGHEMSYGNWEAKLDALAPVFARTRYLHGRVGNSCCMQLPISHGQNARGLADHTTVWQRCLDGYEASSEQRVPFIFAPELLPPPYAQSVRQSDGSSEEVCDRWHEAGLLCQSFRALLQPSTI